MKTMELTKSQICSSICQMGGEDIAFTCEDGSKGFSLETWTLDRAFVILGFFKDIKELHKRLEEKDGAIDVYLNYYPEEKKVVIDVYNIYGNEEEEEIEVTGEGKDFLIQEITNWCNDYKHCTPEELCSDED